MSIKATSINSAGNESIKQSRENYLNINHIICNSQMNGNSRAIRLLRNQHKRKFTMIINCGGI